jgi:pyruvate dehydrogenase E2 component (dihydrolipoamide acetyltransferase)
MATKVILPKLGQTMEEGTIVEWLKQEGDPVAKGDVLFQVESDKAVLEVESKAKGVLRKIVVAKGIKVPVLSMIAIVGEANEDISGLLAGAPQATGPVAPAVAAEAPAAPTLVVLPTPAGPVPIVRERTFASPRARKLAAEKGVDLAYVAGSGPEGRIVEKDVLAFLEKQPVATPLARKVAQEMGVSLEQVSSAGARITAAEVRGGIAPAPEALPAIAAIPAPAAPAVAEITPMAGVRAIIADRMGTSAHTTASVTLQTVVDATEFVAVREKLKDTFAKELGFSIGYNDILAVIVARCLTEFPTMNVRLQKEGIVHLSEVNMGMAVDTERGLLVPVVRGADKLGVKGFASKFRELVERARQGKSLPDDLTGGTFTITNLGMFGVDAFTPIINLPECAILGVGRIRPEPAVVDGQVVVRQHMWLSLTFDHRLVDGAPAARFLQGISRYLEAPYLLLA